MVTAAPELAKQSSSWQRAGYGGGDRRTSEPGGVVPGDWRPRGTERPYQPSRGSVDSVFVFFLFFFELIP